jgi:hypothetical protein
MITEDKIKRVQQRIKDAITQIEQQEGVSIQFSTIRYNSAYYSTTMKVNTTEKNEKVNSVYEKICRQLGFSQNVVGMTFTGTNGEMTIIDIKTKNRKYPVIAQGKTGTFKYTVEQIKRLIGLNMINRNANLDKLLGYE